MEELLAGVVCLLVRDALAGPRGTLLWSWLPGSLRVESPKFEDGLGFLARSFLKIKGRRWSLVFCEAVDWVASTAKYIIPAWWMVRSCSDCELLERKSFAIKTYFSVLRTSNEVCINWSCLLGTPVWYQLAWENLVLEPECFVCLLSSHQAWQSVPWGELGSECTEFFLSDGKLGPGAWNPQPGLRGFVFMQMKLSTFLVTSLCFRSYWCCPGTLGAENGDWGHQRKCNWSCGCPCRLLRALGTALHPGKNLDPHWP